MYILCTGNIGLFNYLFLYVYFLYYNIYAFNEMSCVMLILKINCTLILSNDAKITVTGFHVLWLLPVLNPTTVVLHLNMVVHKKYFLYLLVQRQILSCTSNYS